MHGIKVFFSEIVISVTIYNNVLYDSVADVVSFVCIFIAIFCALSM